MLLKWVLIHECVQSFFCVTSPRLCVLELQQMPKCQTASLVSREIGAVVTVVLRTLAYLVYDEKWP